MTGQQLIDTVTLSAAGHAFLRCRDPHWANPDAYLRVSVLVGVSGARSLGPWAHLFDRRTQEAIGEPTPQACLTPCSPFSLEGFLRGEHDVWTGPLDPADRAMDVLPEVE